MVFSISPIRMRIDTSMNAVSGPMFKRPWQFTAPSQPLRICENTVALTLKWTANLISFLRYLAMMGMFDLPTLKSMSKDSRSIITKFTSMAVDKVSE